MAGEPQLIGRSDTQAVAEGHVPFFLSISRGVLCMCFGDAVLVMFIMYMFSTGALFLKWKSFWKHTFLFNVAYPSTLIFSRFYNHGVLGEFSLLYENF